MSRLPKVTRQTAPRMSGTAALWKTTGIVNGTAERGDLAICADGRIYFGLVDTKYTAGDVVDGKRVLTGETKYSGVTTLLVDDEVYTTLLGMVGRK